MTKALVDTLGQGAIARATVPLASGDNEPMAELQRVSELVVRMGPRYHLGMDRCRVEGIGRGGSWCWR